MSLRIIHVLSNIERVNFGIWNAALFAHEYLAKHNVRSIAVVCSPVVEKPPAFPSLETYFFETFEKLIADIKGDTSKDIFVTHGCWLKPSRVGHDARKQGYRWVYVPHGMLEDWSMQQGKFKKRIYYSLFERRYANRATRVRAVSDVEQKNLSLLLNRKVDFIANGVHEQPQPKKESDIIRFLFLGRLHFKKGILPLVKAWKNVMADMPSKRLIIAGPDEGELAAIQPYINGNIEYIGPVYGDQKSQLLSGSHYFLLPSFSEGFPVSALEAMSYGLIPMISKGCNFDRVFEEKLGYQVEPDDEQISGVLRELRSKEFDRDLSEKNRSFISREFSEHVIGDRLINFYNSISN